MKQNHFIMGYYGNKRREVKIIYDQLNLNDDIKYIVEPFCGTFALSYYISLQHPNKYTYILNDNHPRLIELIELSKNEEEFNKFIDKVKNIVYDESYDKNKHNETRRNINNDLESYFIINTFYNVRVGCFPIIKNINYDKMKIKPVLNFIRNEKFILTCKDAVEIYDEYKDREDSIIFLDPPYYNTWNNYGNKSNTDIYKYLYDNDFNLNKAHIIIVVDKHWTMEALFKNYIVSDHNIEYQARHTKTKHILISNKKNI